MKHICRLGAMLCLLLVGGCEGTERPLSYEKGSYGGKADQQLSPEAVKQLQERTTLQGS